MTIFQGIGYRTSKMNITFSIGNGVPNMVLRFFPQKTPYWLNESEESSFGGTFSPYQWFYWTNCFQKKVRFTHVWTRTNHVNFMKIGSKLCDLYRDSNNYYKLKI